MISVKQKMTSNWKVVLLSMIPLKQNDFRLKFLLRNDSSETENDFRLKSTPSAMIPVKQKMTSDWKVLLPPPTDRSSVPLSSKDQNVLVRLLTDTEDEEVVRAIKYVLNTWQNRGQCLGVHFVNPGASSRCLVNSNVTEIWVTRHVQPIGTRGRDTPSLSAASFIRQIIIVLLLFFPFFCCS